MTEDDKVNSRSEAGGEAFALDQVREGIGLGGYPFGANSLQTRIPSPKGVPDKAKPYRPAPQTRTPEPTRAAGCAEPTDRADRTTRETMVKEAFDEARMASAAALDAMPDASHGTDGRIRDLCGFAYVIAYEVSPWLRVVLKRLGEAKTNGKGEWRFHNLRQTSMADGIQANMAASEAACRVLKTRLGNDARFFVESGLD